METLQDINQRAGRNDPARREGIIRVAHAAFLADGYAATSMSSIAARLGGSKGTLYNYFQSKEELFVAVVESKCEVHQAYIYDVEMAGGPLEEALREMGRRFLEFVLGEEAIATYRLVTAESARFPELGRALYQRGFQVGIAKLAAYFRRAADAGMMEACDFSLAAEHFFELCKSGIHHRRLWNVTPPPSPAEIDDHVAKIVAVFTKAYVPRA